MSIFLWLEAGAYAGDFAPSQAWELLENKIRSAHFDVRTNAKLGYAGLPTSPSSAEKLALLSGGFYRKRA